MFGDPREVKMTNHPCLAELNCRWTAEQLLFEMSIAGDAGAISSPKDSILGDSNMGKGSSEKKPAEQPSTEPSRRKFIKKSSILVAGGAVAGNLALSQAAHAYGSDEIKIGMVGCGGRGTGAATVSYTHLTLPTICSV